MGEQQGRDRRKYQRVTLEPVREALVVEIVGYGPTKLFDMSYEGAALTQPLGHGVTQVGMEVELRFHTQVDQASLQAEVIRTNENNLAVRFREVGVSARIIIDRLVTDRIVGLNMNLIDPRHYAAGEDFTHWYHGPKETNVYLWWQAESLHRGQMEMAGATVIYDGDSLYFENREAGESTRPLLNNKQIGLKAMAILQQMASTEPALLTFRQLISDHVQV